MSCEPTSQGIKHYRKLVYERTLNIYIHIYIYNYFVRKVLVYFLV